MRAVIPIYIGEDLAFQGAASGSGGLDIMVTGGPAAESYFLR